MSADTVWTKAADTTVTVDGTAQKCTDCERAISVGEFETTNLTSPRDANGLLQYEGGNDVVTVTLRMTVVVDSDSPDPIPHGTLLPASYAVNGYQTTSGKIRVSNATINGSPKGALNVKIEGKYTGEVTTS